MTSTPHLSTALILLLCLGGGGNGIRSGILATFAQQEECTVTIQNGTILGAIRDTLNPEKKVCSYTAIPYAAPPVGPLRFMAPQPALAWGSSNPLNATSFPNWCPQMGEIPGFNMTEDCLYLNVYTPLNSSPGDNLPVMLWIHGGGYNSGHSLLYSPTKLLARGDIILVVIHYRLGLLGFLSTGDSVSPGNNGLKDQQQAIRWVNENIGAFGGNPGQVTLFGESAGASSVMYQMISPLNVKKGLISAVICQSGSTLSPVAYDRTPVTSAQIMASRLGCPTSTSVEIVDCLREVDWQTIVEETDKFVTESYQNFTYGIAAITPVVEPDLPGAFITKTPLELTQSGEIDDIPVMLGSTKHDGSFVLGYLHMYKLGPEGLDKDPEYMKFGLIPDMLPFFGVEVDEANGGNVASVEMAYLSQVNRSSWNESMPGLVDIMSVFAFKSSNERTAQILTKRNLNVYLYSFEHHSEETLWSQYFPPSLNVPVTGGISHADDLMYLFDFSENLSPEDRSFSELLCDLWLNFAKFGNPTPSESDRYDQWPPYNTIDEPYMKLNATPKVFPNHRSTWRPNGFQWN